MSGVIVSNIHHSWTTQQKVSGGSCNKKTGSK